MTVADGRRWHKKQEVTAAIAEERIRSEVVVGIKDLRSWVHRVPVWCGAERRCA